MPVARVLAAAAVVALAGCGPDAARPQVAGTVMYRGTPVGNKTLHLVFDAPVGESFSQPFPLGPDGTFTGEVPKPGAYKVMVTESLAEMENYAKNKGQKSPAGVVLPPKYRAADTSDVTVTINPGKNENLVIELKD